MNPDENGNGNGSGRKARLLCVSPIGLPPRALHEPWYEALYDSHNYATSTVKGCDYNIPGCFSNYFESVQLRSSPTQFIKPQLGKDATWVAVFVSVH
jgi:hypothetical protein